MAGRTKKSFFNVASNFIVVMTNTVLSFVSRTVFINILGETALGLNGLFTNILSMLSLAELGIGTAINFSLYKPLAEKDKNKVGILMSFYKKAYIFIGTSELLIGIMLIPFLGVFIKEIDSINNVYLIYLMYLINTTFTYYISYKETLIYADQKGYELTLINVIGSIVLNVGQIVSLITTKKYIVYLFTQFAAQLIQRIVINIYIGKKYNDIDFKCKEKLDEIDKNEITKNIKAMFFHKIGDFCINGTDNLIISSFINVTTVGIYSNYLMIINVINSFISNSFNSITSSLGNLIATESDEKKDAIFNKINFIAFILYGGCSVCLINVVSVFIKMWIGEKYCLDAILTSVIVINFYLTGMRVPVYLMKSASGLYDVDKFAPLIQSAINLVVSILLVKKIGLLGVILGTLISSVLPCWQRPYLVYKYVLHKSSKEYFINYIKYICVILFCVFASNAIINMFNISNTLLNLIMNGMISALIFIIAVVMIFRNSVEFKYLKNLIKRGK